MKTNGNVGFVVILSLLMSQVVLAAGSSCEGDECFFEEPNIKRSKKDREWPPQPSSNAIGGMPTIQLSQIAKTEVSKKVKTRQRKKALTTSQAKAPPREGNEEIPVNGNIPSYMMRHDAGGEHYSVGPIAVNSKEITEKISGVRDGDVLYANLPQRIKASPQAPTSIRVTLLSGPRRGSFLMGTATLDPELKRVFLTFNKFRNNEDDEVYMLDAEGQNLSGERGIEGEYHTEEGKFFLASLVTGFLGVLADSSVNRNQTTIGGWTQEPSLANSALTSAGSTLVQQGNRLAQKADSAPQYTQTDGDQMIRVMIKSDPIRKL